MHLRDVEWAVTEQSLVTPVDRDLAGGVTVLVQQLGALTQQMPPTAPAFVLAESDEGVTINGVYVDLGEQTQSFRNIMDEAAAVAAIGQTYLSDPEAAPWEHGSVPLREEESDNGA